MFRFMVFLSSILQALSGVMHLTFVAIFLMVEGFMVIFLSVVMVLGIRGYR
jgi:hypothetical protein